MARQKGMLNLSGNIEVNAGAPFDARDIVPTKADLTVASNFPYAYVGMETYVVAEDKKYRYMGGGVETLSNWVEVGSGGGTTYNDFVGATDLANGVHGLVPAPLIADKDKFLKGDGSWAEIAMPNVDLSNEISGYNIYSTTEKMIGQWIDGKPLYQKTLEFTIALGANTYAHNIINLESIVSMDGMLLTDRPIPYVNNDALANQVQLQCSETTGILVSIKTSVFVGKQCCVTLRYTKTTDTAMPIGTPNDYSTTEKIVGTWIDGKPLYQKVVDFGALPNNTEKSVNSGITNIDTVVKLDAIMNNNSFGIFTPDINGISVYERIYYNKNENKIYIANNINQSEYNAYVTIQYTKTTD